MSMHICKCGKEWHIRYPGLSEAEAQSISDKINGGVLTETEPLRREVAMLLNMFNSVWCVIPQDSHFDKSTIDRANESIANLQATALAYEHEVEQIGAVKALEDMKANCLASMTYTQTWNQQTILQFINCAIVRATSKKG